MRLACGCCIVPIRLLEKFAKDQSLSKGSREAFKETAKLEPSWRNLRIAHQTAVQSRLASAPNAMAVAVAASPIVKAYDCKNGTTLPGVPASAGDPTAKRALSETKNVARFFKSCFGRNSIDGSGMTLVSSVHYGIRYNNAFWNGAQMTYGDGDGQIFVDFTRSNDVICHELTHGVTQYTAGLVYSDEPGALNESLSDVFGSMFRQWSAAQDFLAADWLIGSGIIGPKAKAKGFKCLRDLASPGAKHCLSPQPDHYSKYVPGGDVHENSGIPNHAFYQAAKAIGGQSWVKAGKVWYAALTSSSMKSTTKFRAFAKLTRAAAKNLFPADPAVYAGVNSGWKAVGL